MEKKNVVIYVTGQRFSITTTDTPEYVMGIGEKIDVMIKGIQKDNPKLNRDACAILAALNICDDETKLRQMMEVLREQVKDYLVANETLRAENSALKKELEELKSATPTVSAPATTEKEQPAAAEKEAPKSVAVSPAVPSKTESAVAAAVQRQTAFVGKDFRSDKYKKNQQHTANVTKPAAPAPVVATTAPVDPDEAQIQENSPYHQFSIFDDLI